MSITKKIYQTCELPIKIQNLLLEYGERHKLGISELMRTFDQSSLNTLTNKLDDAVINEVRGYLDCYLIHSRNKKTVITSGKII